MMTLIKTADEAARFLDAVQGFHEAFIQDITITSRDSFAVNGPAPGDVSQICTGDFDVRIIVTHHPARAGNPPSRAITRCVFKHVREICLDLRHLRGFEWPLEEMRIDADLQHDRLRLFCRWKRLTAENEWEDYTQCLLCFQELEAETLRE